jgi:hypothetical protein
MHDHFPKPTLSTRAAKPGVRSDAVDRGIDPEKREVERAIVVGFVEPLERLISLAQAGLGMPAPGSPSHEWTPC